MENKSPHPLKLEKTTQFLNNVEKSDLREDALSAIKQAGIDGVSLVVAKNSGIFHSDDGLSPAGGIAVAPDGTIFLSDEFNHRISVYTQDGKLEQVTGSKGSGDGEFHYPRGIAIDKNGKLYIADAWNHRIVILKPNLTFSKSFGKLGSGSGELDEPVDVSIWNGMLAVVEKSNHRVQFFEMDGEPIGTIGGRGSVAEQEAFYVSNWIPRTFSTPVFEFPSAIAVNEKETALYIADTNNHRVVKLNNDLAVVSWYHLSKIKFPSGLTCDSSGNLHITQFNNKKINVYSPEGIHLYSYDSGIKIPLYTAANGKSIYLADGIKAGVSRLTISPKHTRSICLEDSFSYHLKTAIEKLGNGDWKEAGRNLQAAAETSPKPSPSELAKLLPENDFSFSKPDGECNEKWFEPFTAFLSSQSSKVLKEIENDIAQKASVSDDFTQASLNLEKALLSGTQPALVDELMVSKYLATKKLFEKSSSIREKFTAFKKIEEFSRRFAFYGISVNERLYKLQENLEFILKVNAKSIEWFSIAEKEAPSLNFNSTAKERETFLKNYNRHNFTATELQTFSNFAAEQNCELAGISKILNDEEKKKFDSIVIISLELFSIVPKLFTENSIYLKSLELLFDKLGGKWTAVIIENVSKDALWEQLSREENIKQGENSAYRLLPTLWADEPTEKVELKAGSWGKIRDFYHNEFNRFPKEVEPIQSEQLRLLQQLPLAQKSDPAQAAQIEAKVNLLSFHITFQERYICSMAKEYLLRYAIFSLADGAISQKELDDTKKQLEELARTSTFNFFAMNEKASVRWDEAGRSENSEEKSKLKIDHSVFNLLERYYRCLGAFLKIAEKNISSDSMLKPVTVFHRPLEVSEPLSAPMGLSITNGQISILYNDSPNLIKLDLNGKVLSNSRKFGKVPKAFLLGLDYRSIGNSNFLLSHGFPSGLIEISSDGESTRKIEMDIKEGRIPFRVSTDSDGNFYLSFVDGIGISVFDSNGKLVREIGADKFAGIKKVWGFLLRGDKIIAGGNGKFISLDLQGNEKKSFSPPNETFSAISSIASDEHGNTFAIAVENNKLFRLTSKLDSIELIKINSQGLITIATEKNYIVLADYTDGTVKLFKTDFR